MGMSTGAKAKFCLALAVLLAGSILGGTALAQGGVVWAVLFYTPTCPHCIKVRTETLPPLRAQYGQRLQILEVDASQPQGHALYGVAADQMGIPEERRAFPTLIIDTHILVGSKEIPDQLPGLIASYLARGGVGLPPIPGLPVAPAELPVAQNPGWRGAFMRDPAGNGVSVAVLLGLLVSLALATRPQGWQKRLAQRFGWVLPIATLIGLAVAGYLAHVETTHTQAFCGPVGDCNAVQQSRYALLFGFLPVGVFGVLGYLAILGSWTLGSWGRGEPARLARATVWLLAAFGVLFSVYLTFLEPFVIGATCVWCLASAVCMALILLLSTGPGWAAFGAARAAGRAAAA